MKRFLSVLLMLTILVSFSSGVDVSAATAKLTARETAIAKAYVKAYESGSMSSMKSYLYPASKLTVKAVPSTVNVKMFVSKYSKQYDSKAKMNCILLSCVIIASDGSAVAISSGTVGVNLKTKSNKVYAYSKNTTKAKMVNIKVSDLTPTQVSGVEAYLADKYGEDSVSKILYGIVEAPSATAEAPAELGSRYTYDIAYSRKGDTLSGSFGVTVNSVTALTEDDLKKAGYVKTSHEVTNAEYFEYKLVSITWDVKDAKIAKFEPGNSTGYVYKRFIRPVIMGSVFAVNTSNYLNYIKIDGFASSLQSKLDAKFKSSNLKSGETVSFSVTGDIILPVRKGEDVYLRLQKAGTGDVYSEDLYFKLK